MPITTFQATFLKKEKNSLDAFNFYFKKPKSFSYQAGQYIKMTLDIKNPDNRGVTRYFTLSSSPTDEYLMITTRIIKSTFKMRLSKLKAGDKVKMRGPWGDFTFLEKSTKPVVFLSGGIGITPFHSLIRYATEKGLPIPITLIASYKTPDEIFYVSEFNSILALNPHVKIIMTMTQPENTEWKGETGRISTELLHKLLANLQDNVYYIAGPDPMVEALEKLLISLKIDKRQILTDGFPGY